MNKLNDCSRQQMIYAKKLVYSILSELLKSPFYSQATQDIFVSTMLKEKRSGFFLEIGGGHPTESNNTFLLESRYEWNGFSIELDDSLVECYNLHRRNRSVLADATSFDYLRQLESMDAPKQVDYLSIDIDPAEKTYGALLQLPHSSYRFSVITFEHDRYQSGDQFMELSRRFLKNLGYQLVVSNLQVFGRDFEDWWIDPNVIGPDIWTSYRRDSIEFSTLWL